MSEETLNDVADSSISANTGADAGSQSTQTNDTANTVESTATGTTDKVATSTSTSEKPKDAKAPAPTARSVVSDLLKGEKTQEGKPSVPKQARPGQTPELNPDGTKKDGATDDKTKEDDPLHKHPRFQEVIKERNEVREQLKAVEPELADYRNIVGFMDSNSLKNEEVFEGFKIMAALKNNPALAAQMLAPHIAALNQFLGISLPPNLQKQVEDGLITPEAARQLAATQNQNAHLQTQSVAQRQRQEQEVQARQQQQATQAIQGSVAGWEAQKKASDPDYAKKYSFFESALRVAIQAQPPRTSQEAVTLADRIYKEVSKNLLGVMPSRQPITPIPSTTSSSNGSSAPKTAREAVAAVLEKSRSQ